MTDIQLQGMPVWVYSRNIDNQKVVAPSRLVEGALGSTYTVEPKPIEGYKFVRADGEIKGQLGETMHTVTLYYRPESYLEAQKLEGKYLHVVAPVNTYRDVDGEPDGFSLWANMVVKVVNRVATANGKFWYQMADSRWVPFSMHQMSLSNDDGQNSEQGWQLHTAWEPTPMTAEATIDFVPERRLNVYDRPYGEIIGQIVDGAPVAIIEKVEDDADNVWYHMDQYGWVSSLYIKMK